jgi:hypothetical protein
MPFSIFLKSSIPPTGLMTDFSIGLRLRSAKLSLKMLLVGGECVSIWACSKKFCYLTI